MSTLYSGNILLFWDPVDGATSYSISGDNLSITGLTQTYYQIDADPDVPGRDFVIGNTYSFTVTASTPGGPVEVGSGSVVAACGIPSTAQPYNIQAVQGDGFSHPLGTTTVSWEGGMKCDIYYSLNSIEGDPDPSSYQYENVSSPYEISNSNKLYVVLKPHLECFQGHSSSVGSKTVNDIAYVVISYNSIFFAWTEVMGASSYNVYVGTDPTFSNNYTKYSTTNFYVTLENIVPSIFSVYYGFEAVY